MKRSGPRRKAGLTPWTGARVALILVTATILVIGVAFTATNVVPPTNVGDVRVTDLPTTDSLPAECEGMTFDVTGSGSGVIAGSLGNDWITGSDQADTISGLSGADCLEGKGGNDVLEGGFGTDVCIGGGGTDTFVSCETQVQ